MASPISQPGYSTIIFDLDGTLADTLPLIYVAFNAALEPVLGRTLGEVEIRGMFGPPDNQILMSLIPGEAGEAAIARYVETYERDHRLHVSLFEGLASLLEAARQNGIKLAVVTGKSRITALFTLEMLGVARYFDVIYAGDDVQRQKPDPEAILAAISDLSASADLTAVIVGDSAADVLAGRAAGIRTIGVLWGSPDHTDLFDANPDQICATVDELRAALGLNEVPAGV